MKKVILLLIVCMLAVSIQCNICYAAPIDVNLAKVIASNFYCSNSDKKIESITVEFTETTKDGYPAYYVFNINTKDGFVIVTADDAALPVIGYATTGHYDADKVVPPLIMWLEKRKNEISYIRTHNLAATEDIKKQWQTYQYAQNKSNARTTAGVYQLCSTTWNQTEAYSVLCPGQAPTGCVATAMAQIMKYWNYPPHGIGSLTYDDTTSLGFSTNYGKLSADFGNTTYNWSAMPNYVNPPFYDTETVVVAVATLMYHCGVSVYTDYLSIGSSANMIPFDSVYWHDPYGNTVCSQAAYAQYFGYDSASMKGVRKVSYSTQAWDSLLENELNNNRPIQYAANDAFGQGGHCWVCDGYDANTNFHMNWGWGGEYNGYFQLDNLNPATYEFTDGEEALIGIQPPSSAGIKENSLERVISIYPNPTHGKFTVYSLQFEIAGIEVYNLLGAKLFQSTNQQINNSTIDLSSEPAGVYVVRIQSGEGVIDKKVVIE